MTNTGFTGRYCDEHQTWECESCAETSEHTPAVRHSTNPDWSGYDLCEECAQEYDARERI